MKQTFVILFSIVATLLLSSGNSYGQSPYVDTPRIIANIGSIDNWRRTKQDTVHCLMLVCDTSKYPQSSMMYFTPQSTAFNEHRGVWWIYGYGVCRFEYWIGGSRACNSKEYLDQYKNPLSKNIIVWITKEIK